MSTSKEQGVCMICGAETFKRCGDCAENGTDFLYFCSMKHKKLVASVHKRVCGIRSKPFSWPGLDPIEYRDVFVMSKQKMYNREGQISTWFERFSNNPQARGKDPDLLFEEKMEPFVDPGRGIQMSPESSASVVDMRHTLWNTWAEIEHFRAGTTEKTQRQKEVVRRTGLPQRPFDFVAATLEASIPGFASTLSSPRYANWSGDIMHIYMIYIAVAAVSMTDSSEEIKRYLGFTKKAIIAMIQYVIPASEREIRQGLLASLQHVPPQVGTS